MRKLKREIRLYISELFLGWAFAVSPKYSSEKKKLADLIKEYYHFNNPFQRRSGRSTRLADKYIQNLFRDGEIIIHDHHPTRRANRWLFEKIMDRIKNEHPDDFDRLWFSGNELKITIKNNGGN